MKIGDIVTMRYTSEDYTKKSCRSYVGVVVEIHDWKPTGFFYTIPDEAEKFVSSWSSSLGKRVVVLWSDSMKFSSMPEQSLRVVS